MYSRAPRQFLPTATLQNPSLSPGCYETDRQLPPGKLLGCDGYAPFLSLTPRQEVFLPQPAENPPPCTYSLNPAHGPTKVVQFGKSQAERFQTRDSNVPGPGYYRVESDTRRMSSRAAAFNAKIQSSQPPKVVWQRKFVPPSIPVGEMAHGYDETNNGELLPRKVPKEGNKPGETTDKETIIPSTLSTKGVRFGKGPRTSLIRQSDLATPSPTQYDVAAAERALRSTHVHTVPPPAASECRRMMENIVATAVKQATPAPGAYEIKVGALKEVKRRRPFMHSVSDTGLRYLNQEQLHTPSPAAYNVAHPAAVKRLKPKTASFGSKSKRFESADELRAATAPAPGQYEIEIQAKMSQTAHLRPFCASSERFKPRKIAPSPAPNSYNPIPVQRSAFDPELPEEITAPRFIRTHYAYVTASGAVAVDPYQLAHIPVFGTQTERFEGDQKHHDLPPPGSYDVAEAFEKLQKGGRMAPHISSGAAKGELFAVKEEFPSPNQYDVAHSNKMGNGAFVSTEKRFLEDNKTSEIPGPGAYVAISEETLIRKTFNVTLGHGVAKGKELVTATADQKPSSKQQHTQPKTSKGATPSLPGMEPLIAVMRAPHTVST
ncbi:hypothetical protein SmJEL517_g03593 [Synchytrium microbalum]|uniref:Sperm-tail PG-rich repeat-containing protein 2 n=1 Tax=Synchytrium microbalum TaxID=1806994 RepID=A0A507C7K7_9FUNG|nr:uncharacterized protein SmJEL517_g03593 [Synchytrium microbalum]TPX33513.1 hypothetical protein SmJEL517_g03593 [Synchytrium microbalum]